MVVFNFQKKLEIGVSKLEFIIDEPDSCVIIRDHFGGERIIVPHGSSSWDIYSTYTTNVREGRALVVEHDFEFEGEYIIELVTPSLIKQSKIKVSHKLFQ